MKRKFITYFMAIVLVAGTLLFPQASNITTADAATFNDLNQSQIVAALGAGYNLGNTLEANVNGYPDETSWGNPKVTASQIQMFKNAGFKTIRIPLSFMYTIGSAPDYKIDTAKLNRVKEVVDYAIDCGFFVIIDLHGDSGPTPGGWIDPVSSDQTTIKAKMQKVWSQIAATFKDYDEHLIFESMNEVGSETYDPNVISAKYHNINEYNQIFVDAVRATGGNNTKRWLLIPGWNTNIDFTAGNYGFTIPSDNSCTASGNRIMVSVHYYSPWSFCGDASPNITQWGSVATDQSKVETWGGEDFMISQVQAMYNKFVTQGYPVVIGEYAATDKSHVDPANAACRVHFYKRMCELSKAYGCVPLAWDAGYNGEYQMGLFDRNTLTITQPTIVNAIMNVFSPNGNPTVIPTAAPTAAPTATPTVTPTVTPSITPSPGTLDVKFFGTVAAQSNSINGKYKLTNNTSTDIPLADVKLRYYYTKEGSESQNFFCDWSNIGGQNVSGTFLALSPSKTNANYYLEISFSAGAGNLAPGQSIEVYTRFAKDNWTDYNQTNDYSYNSSATSFVNWDKITAYISNTLVYGVEP